MFSTRLCAAHGQHALHTPSVSRVASMHTGPVSSLKHFFTLYLDRSVTGDIEWHRQHTYVGECSWLLVCPGHTGRGPPLVEHYLTSQW